jgi:hypothetical protein
MMNKIALMANNSGLLDGLDKRGASEVREEDALGG